MLDSTLIAWDSRVAHQCDSFTVAASSWRVESRVCNTQNTHMLMPHIEEGSNFNGPLSAWGTIPASKWNLKSPENKKVDFISCAFFKRCYGSQGWCRCDSWTSLYMWQCTWKWFPLYSPAALGESAPEGVRGRSFERGFQDAFLGDECSLHPRSRSRLHLSFPVACPDMFKEVPTSMLANSLSR